jgi:hypothetical protein
MTAATAGLRRFEAGSTEAVDLSCNGQPIAFGQGAVAMLLVGSFYVSGMEGKPTETICDDILEGGAMQKAP